MTDNQTEENAGHGDPYLTAAFIEQRATEQKALYSNEDLKILNIRDLRQMTKEVVMPEGRKFVDTQVRGPELADEGERVVSALTINGFKLNFTPARLGVQKDQDNAENRESFHESLLHEVGKRHPGEETFYAAVDACVNDGGGWTKVIYAPDLWEARDSIQLDDFDDDDDYPQGEGARSAAFKYEEATEDAKKACGPPIYWLPCDVASVYPTFSGLRLSEMFEVTERPFFEVMRMFKLGWKGGKVIPTADFAGEPVSWTQRTRPPAILTVIEYWSPDSFCYVIRGPSNSAMVGPFPHEYDRVPYFFMPGYMMNWWRGKKIGMGVGETKSWLVDYKNFLRTIHANVVARDAFAPMFRERPINGAMAYGDDGQPVQSTEYDLGVIIEGAGGEKISAFDFPPVAKSLQEEIAMVNQDIERLMTPRVNPEIGGGGLEGAGFAIAQVIAEARIKDAPFIRHIETGVVEIVLFIEHLIKNVIKDTVWVRTVDGSGWLSLGPDDFKVKVGITCQLDPERPAAKLIEERYYTEMVNAGLCSQYEAMEEMGRDPDKTRFLRTIERQQNSDWFIQYEDQETAQQLGAGDIIAKARAAAQLAATGSLQSNPSGGPPGQLGQPPTPAMGSQQVPDMGKEAAGQGPGRSGGPAGGAPQANTKGGAAGIASQK